MTMLPSHASVVIVGGGAVGTSIAYHLAKAEQTDVLLLERGRLTCGSTWHAAGLVMQLRSTHSMTEICRYGVGLFPELEAETGLSVGFRQNGSLPIARTEDRLHEIARLVSLGKVFGIEAHMLSPAEAKERYPLLDQSQIVGGAFIPGDGQINPADLTMAYATGARGRGAVLREGVTVTGFEQSRGRVTAVLTDCGRVACDRVVLACGLWTRELAALTGAKVPLYASAHMYVTTEPHERVVPHLPVLRDTDGFNYIKEDAGKLLVGAFEPNAKALPSSALPRDQQFIELAEDWDQFELPMSRAMETVPLLRELGIRHFLNAPESFTPDNRFILGEATGVRDLFIAAGFNSQGILASAGVGRVMAQWLIEGRPRLDVSEMDIRRFHGFEANERFLRERVSESLGLLYQMHWPHRQFESARRVRETPLYHRLAEHRAVFGTAAGWERANWFARPEDRREYVYSYGRQNWFEAVAEECAAVRNRVGLFDLSSFGKILIQGPDACRELERIVAADMDQPPGKVIYAQMLNERGGIESDLTFTRLAEDRYLAVTAAAQQSRDRHWLESHVRPGAFVTVTDVSSGHGTLAVMGPDSRALLEALSDADLSSGAFPFGTARTIAIGASEALAMRVSYVGELGWEIYPTTDFLGPIFDGLLAEGRNFGLRLAGYHALDALRQEKGYRHWGHDVTPSDTPLEAGLAFAISRSKRNYIGAEALERQREQGLKRRLIHVRLLEPEPILDHDEPIWLGDQVIGATTSGCFGHTLGTSVAQGYIGLDRPVAEMITDRQFAVEIAGMRFSAEVSTEPFFDPSGSRLRS